MNEWFILCNPSIMKINAYSSNSNLKIYAKNRVLSTCLSLELTNNKAKFVYGASFSEYVSSCRTEMTDCDNCTFHIHTYIPIFTILFSKNQLVIWHWMIFINRQTYAFSKRNLSFLCYKMYNFFQEIKKSWIFLVEQL